MNVHELSADEKILLAEELWESVRAEADSTPLSAAQKAELDRRLAAYQVDERAEGDTWETVKGRLLKE